MENRVDDFVAGVEATFGHLARSSEELAGFLQASKRFYLDFIGFQDPVTSPQANNELPFWRYLVFYSTLALDHAATSTSLETDELEEQKHRELAGELSTCWPLLGMLVSRQYAASAASQLSTAVPPKESNDMHGSRRSAQASSLQTSTADKEHTAPTAADDASRPRPALHRHASIARAVEPLTPPIYYARPTIATEPDAVASQPTSTSTAVPWDGYLDRTTGRSLSESTQFSTSSTSTYPSELLATPPTYQAAEPFFAVNDEPTYPASTALGGHPSFMDIHPPATGGKQQHRWTSRFSTTIPKDQNTSSPDTQLLLADRGDSTAKLVPKQQGGYELDVEIGGNAIVFDPEKPTQIQYRGSDISAQGTPVSKPQELSTRVLLADRGDNTARLVPTADGAYVLDVSIGGKKLIINPERPSEIQYHDSQGLVVTQSLFSPEITAQ